jgi:hypothetical protein
VTTVPVTPLPEHVPADTAYVAATLRRLRLLGVEMARQAAAGNHRDAEVLAELRRSLLDGLTRAQLEFLVLLAVPMPAASAPARGVE